MSHYKCTIRIYHYVIVRTYLLYYACRRISLILPAEYCVNVNGKRKLFIGN